MSCDSHEGLLPYEQALKQVLALAESSSFLGSSRMGARKEEVPISQALGRVVAETIYSSEPVPPFDNSAMDGFLVSVSDTESASEKNPMRLKVVGLIAAGELHSQLKNIHIKPGDCIEIMTGAAVPELGLNAVVKVESVLVEKDSSGNTTSIIIRKPARSGDNIRLKGSDFDLGTQVIPAGKTLFSDAIMALASLGQSKVKVLAQPKVAIISTGSELVDYTESTLLPGQIRNSTGLYIVSTLQELGVTARYLGVASDDPVQYQKIISDCVAEKFDIIVSTGAVSMGKFDFVKDSLTQLGAKILFHKTAIRPGKPILVAEVASGCAFFGVPGNPVSTAVGVRFFVEPYIRALLGLSQEVPLRGVLAHSVKKPKNLVCFYKASVAQEDAQYQVQVSSAQGSYVVSSLVDSNAWVVLRGSEEILEKNTIVDFYSLSQKISRGE